MAVKNRPSAARDAMGQQQAAARRGAPGKRFIGDTAEQSAAARRAQRHRVEQIQEEGVLRVERAEARRRAAEPVSAILVELLEDSFRLARTLATAPFRIARALLRPQEA